MSEVRLAAELRTEFGKGAARRTRRAGKIPAVLYGHGTDPKHVALPALEFARVVREHGRNAVVTAEKPSRIPRRTERVAVIGGGLCGMTAAHDLARKGYAVTLFEALTAPFAVRALDLLAIPKGAAVADAGSILRIAVMRHWLLVFFNTRVAHMLRVVPPDRPVSS